MNRWFPSDEKSVFIDETTSNKVNLKKKNLNGAENEMKLNNHNYEITNKC
jgi:hypothetical protein